MAHGGSRSGAGRKAGSLTKRTREIAEKAVEGGVTPLEYMLSLLRDENNEQAVRFEAAKHAAPFVHPKLSSVEAKVDVDVGGDFGEIEWQLVKAPAKDT
jgi:hypothetical protein